MKFAAIRTFIDAYSTCSIQSWLLTRCAGERWGTKDVMTSSTLKRSCSTRPQSAPDSYQKRLRGYKGCTTSKPPCSSPFAVHTHCEGLMVKRRFCGAPRAVLDRGPDYIDRCTCGFECHQYARSITHAVMRAIFIEVESK